MSRRLNIIPNAFGERAVLKLMFAAMSHAVEITEFERHQIKTLTAELDHEYEAQTGLNPRVTKQDATHKLSRGSGT